MLGRIYEKERELAPRLPRWVRFVVFPTPEDQFVMSIYVVMAIGLMMGLTLYSCAFAVWCPEKCPGDGRPPLYDVPCFSLYLLNEIYEDGQRARENAHAFWAPILNDTRTRLGTWIDGLYGTL
jgi:hypothetical protein